MNRTVFPISRGYAHTRRLRRQREAKRLISIGRNPDGQTVFLAPAAAHAWRRMQEAARHDRITLIAISGFRSVRRQTEIINRKLSAGHAMDDILRLIAAPGYSEHHTGRAIDIGSPEELELDERFAQTDAFAWLRHHAGNYGFHLSYPRHNPHGIAFEPWHWCWRRSQP